MLCPKCAAVLTSTQAATHVCGQKEKKTVVRETPKKVKSNATDK